VISVVILAVLLTMLVGNLPASRTRSALAPWVRPLSASLGLEQAWGVFSPDPRRVSIFLEADIELEDGSVDTWRPPVHGGLFGVQRAARWQKYVEFARSDDEVARNELWTPLARWVARSHGGPPAVRRVTLVRVFRDVPPPGDDVGPWKRFAFFSLDPGEQAP
jgi:hypothetical protein